MISLISKPQISWLWLIYSQIGDLVGLLLMFSCMCCLSLPFRPWPDQSMLRLWRLTSANIVKVVENKTIPNLYSTNQTLKKSRIQTDHSQNWTKNFIKPSIGFELCSSHTDSKNMTSLADVIFICSMARKPKCREIYSLKIRTRTETKYIVFCW